ncbi:MAG TPA: radical SAM protein [Bacteroidales bacterium]|nr:radical SAM protein [Bacteroidales bacterium]
MGENNRMELEKQKIREDKNRNKIQETKPLVWEKIQKFPERIKNKQSIALVQLQIDYKCNMKCSHCAIEKFRQNKNKYPHKLDIEKIKDIANQIHEEGLVSVCISGGEPLIFPNLEEIIDAIQPERFVLSIDTNGLELNEEKIKWLVNKGVNRIHLSLDGLERNHNRFRKTKKNSWAHNVKMLPLCKKHGLDVVINIVATKDLVQSKEMEKQLEFIEQFGLHASMIYAKPVGTFEEAKDQVLDQNDLDYLESLTKKYNCSTHLTENHGQYFGCLCFKRHFSITAFGDVLPCPWIPISMGNVFEERLKTILDRGLANKWFSFDIKETCMSGNKDSYFYQNIISQIETFDEYPVHYTKINWHLEYFNKKDFTNG